jgi:hypothetical protein
MFAFFANRGWDDPDWQVRERVALGMRDQKRLLHLAVNDVAEEVRVAAVKSLSGQKTLLHVVLKGACDPSRRLALARITDQEIFVKVVIDCGLPVFLRLAALESLPADPRLQAAYTHDAPAELKIALLERIADDAFLGDVIQSEPERQVRVAAIGRLRSEARRTELALGEQDVELRRMLIEGVKKAAHLREIWANEDDETLRLWLVRRLTDQQALAAIVKEDQNLEVRAIAVDQITDTQLLYEIAGGMMPERLALLALFRLGTQSLFAGVAMSSHQEKVRIKAILLVIDLNLLAQVEALAVYPEIRWLAGRAAGRLAVEWIREVKHDLTLLRLIDAEKIPAVAAWLVGHIVNAQALTNLTASKDAQVATAAHLRLRESLGATGLRLIRIPGRPYALGVFPVTAGQMHTIMGADYPLTQDSDLPATGFSPELALEFCSRISALTGQRYRLPSFEEWRHACLTNDENWLSDKPANQGEAEVALQTQRLPVAGVGPRPIWRSWANPWGMLDMAGNVAVWVEDSPLFVNRQASALAADPLSADGNAECPDDWACAAGATWADPRIRKSRFERLVSRKALAHYAADKVGLRVLLEHGGGALESCKFAIVLLPETAPGMMQADVIALLRRRWIEAQKNMEAWYQVAPLQVFFSYNYEDVRHMKLTLEQCGARVRLVSNPAA